MARLTKRTIDGIKPTGTDHFVWDSELRGFGIRVSPKGQKTYLIQYRHMGRTQRLKLGKTNLLTAEQARKSAKILLGQAEEGKNPALIESKKRSALTLNEVTKRFITEHVETRLKPRTQINYNTVLRKYILPALGHRKIFDIDLKDISSLHYQLKDKPCQANRAVLIMSKVFNLCEQWGYRTAGSNPCRHIDLFKDNKRNRYLDKDELSHLWVTLEKAYEDGTAGLYAINAYRLLILTGCRLGEIQTLKWSYIRGSSVEFPDSKTGYKRIPLNSAALEILNNTPRKPNNEYVICGEKEGSHIVNLQKSWRRIRERANLQDLRIHDLRHTFASQAVMNGTPLALVSKLLGHSKIATTMRYAHLADAELAKASEGIGLFLKN